MHRARFPTGHSAASRLKALRAELEARAGDDAVASWLGALRLTPEDLADETRLLPLAALHAGLEGFVERTSREALADLGPRLVAADTLGAWAKVLRGAQGPEDAFRRLEASESEYGRTVRWEVREACPGRFHGVVHLAHDPELERDGLLLELRRVELEVVPELFGLRRGEARVLASREGAQELEVVWGLPGEGRRALLFAAAWGALGAGALLVVPPEIGLPVAALGAAGGAAFGRARDAADARRAAERGQRLRVAALERSLELRDASAASAAGELDGAVVAGLYRIGARMGAGASGVIYEGVRITDGLPVAVKLLRAASAHDAVASDRLRREAEALGLAWHPNVVESIDHGVLPDGSSYLVLERLEGETLASRLTARGRLGFDETLPIALELTDALAAVHAAGVVHRDVKPANLYLARDAAAPRGERVKLLDFGIARVEWEEMRITNLGAPMGTPGYMAPEQESGGEVDARSDVYALGAVLHECLVGAPPQGAGDPFRADGAPSLAPGAGGGAGEGVSGVQRTAPPVPKGFQALLARALAREPAARFADARAFRAALRALVDPAATPDAGEDAEDDRDPGSRAVP